MAGEYEPTVPQLQAWAKALVGQPEFATFFTGMKADYFRQWLDRPTPEQRELIYARVHAVADIETLLKSLADGADIDARKAAMFKTKPHHGKAKT